MLNTIGKSSLPCGTSIDAVSHGAILGRKGGGGKSHVSGAMRVTFAVIQGVLVTEILLD